MSIKGKMPAAADFFKSDGKGLSSAAIHYLGNVEELGNKFGELVSDGSLIEELHGKFSFPENKTEEIICNNFVGKTLLSLSVHTGAGTATLTPKIGSTTLGGGANSATTSRSTVNHTSANVMAAGDILNFVLSSVSSDCVDLAWSLKYTEDLSNKLQGFSL